MRFILFLSIVRTSLSTPRIHSLQNSKLRKTSVFQLQKFFYFTL